MASFRFLHCSDLHIDSPFKGLSMAQPSLAESLRKATSEIPETMESLRPLIDLKTHRSRIKCMKLAWDALEDCALQHQT